LDFETSGEQEALLDAARKMLSRECPIAFVREVVEDGATDERRLWHRMVELGWPALTVPARFGGLGRSFVDLALLVEELGRAMAPGPFLATVSQFQPIVEEAGTERQRERFLCPLAAGELTGALGIAEHEPNWRLDGIRMRARRDGPGWRLDGFKNWVVDGDTADEIAVAARLEGGSQGHDIGVFVVPGSAVVRTRTPSLDGSRACSRVELSGVHVDADRMLGTPDQSGVALQRALERATTALATEIVGTCQTIFEVTLQYAKDRHQFGRPIGSFQAIQHKLADMLIAIEKARSVCHFSAMTIAEDDPRRNLAASAAKVAAGDCQRLLAKEGIQIHGGIGYTWEHDMHLYVKRAKSGDALLGTSSEHRARIADLLTV
jgi:alkylation response protein AidB-like acyl-CoA dehydrogenase